MKTPYLNHYRGKLRNQRKNYTMWFYWQIFAILLIGVQITLATYVLSLLFPTFFNDKERDSKSKDKFCAFYKINPKFSILPYIFSF